MSGTLSAELADWIHGFKYEDAPQDVRVAARKCLVNSLGTALGAFELRDVQLALSVVRDEGISGQITVLADGSRVPAGAALFVNGVMFNVLGQEETHLVSATHPAETTIPAALGVAEARHRTGRELLEAIIVGTEVTVQVANMALTPSVKYESCEAPAVYGTIGATAAAAKLAGLGEEQIGHALGLAANMAAGLAECVRVGTSEYHFSVGNASPHAYLAMTLAAQGAKAAVTTFEGDAGFYHLFAGVSADRLRAHDVASDVRERLGGDWGLLDFIYKPYPVHFFNQPFADGAAWLRERHEFELADIEEIRLLISPLAAASGGPNMGPFDSRESVLGSTAFCVASMLARGSLGLAETQDYAGPDIAELIAKTSVENGEGLTTARIELQTSQGTFSFDAERDGRDYRLDLDDVVAIARAAAANTFSAAQVDQMIGEVLAVEECGDVAELVRSLVRS